MAQDKGLSSLDKVMIAARAADSKKATDILIQDVRELVGITDFFVIVTAQNNRQISAVLDAIEEAEIKEAGVKPFSVEGAQEGFGRCRTTAISSCMSSSPKGATTIVSRRSGTMRRRFRSFPRTRPRLRRSRECLLPSASYARPRVK